MNDHEESSVLGYIQPKHWSSDTAFSYEAALITIGKVIGWYSAGVFAALEKNDPDHERVEHLLAEQRECVMDQQRLSADAPDQIAERSARYDALLEQLQARGRLA